MVSAASSQPSSSVDFFGRETGSAAALSKHRVAHGPPLLAIQGPGGMMRAVDLAVSPAQVGKLWMAEGGTGQEGVKFRQARARS
jgi:hypothetical protein